MKFIKSIIAFFTKKEEPKGEYVYGPIELAQRRFSVAQKPYRVYKAKTGRVIASGKTINIQFKPSHNEYYVTGTDDEQLDRVILGQKLSWLLQAFKDQGTPFQVILDD